MFQGFGNRIASAIGIVAIAAMAVFVLPNNLLATMAVLVCGIAAVLLAASAMPAPPGTAQPAPGLPVSTAPDIGELLEAIVEPVLVVAGGRVTHANAAARALLGGHVVGEDVRLAIRHPAAAERLANPISGPPQGPIDLVGLGTLDQRWQMHVGRVTGGHRIVHLIDQTGNYAAERMRVDFVANASHELRTPLASILGYIETLDDEAGDDPAVRSRFLKIMFDESRRMQRLVEDLISLSRIEAEKYRLPETPVDLAALIREVRAEMLGARNAGSNQIVADLDADLPPVAGDRAQLSQMLHNLIGNAIKYGRPGAPVTVRLWREQTGMPRISVTDEGDGIAAEHIPRLTERFYRVDAGRSRAAGGTGLGLAIVKHIVERHRGRLDITSTVGKGTTVTVLLPAHGTAVIKR